jgi:2-(1,2-epoxy-1,2-dihydrophenyl)acetyl-CoA isomerase
MRRAQELFLLNRRLTAQEALEFGLVSQLAPSDAVDAPERCQARAELG